MTEALRQLPHSIEAEQALLGLVMCDNSALERLPENLRGDHFHEPFHGRLFDRLLSVVASGVMAEPRILSAQMADDPALPQFGGQVFLIDLMDKAPPSYTAHSYGRTIYDLALRRDLIRLGEELAGGAGDTSLTALEHLGRVEDALFTLAETGEASKGILPFSDALSEAMDMAAAAYQRDGKLAGLATDLTDLDQKLGGLHPSDLLILAGRPSMGKAQPLHAKVLMADGTWSRMGDLRFGDAVASVDGQRSLVTGVFPQGDREVFRVTLSDGRSTLASAEHLWTAESSKWAERRRTVTTADLARMVTKTRYQRRISLPMVSGDFGEDLGLPMDPWLLGAILGNGGIGGTSVMFSTADAATLFRVQKIVGSDRVRHAGGDYDYRIVANDCTPDQNVAFALVALGLRGLRSHEKFIPPCYLRASRPTRLAVLQGLMDTDGWVETFGAVRIALSSQQLAEDVQTLVRSLGGTCTIKASTPRYSYKGENREGRTSYTCNITHPDRPSLMTLARKRRRCGEAMRFRAPTIVSVERVGVEPVQCIAVSHPDHLYVTDDYIVTHNTALATNVAFNVARIWKGEPCEDSPGGMKTKAGGRVLFFSLEMSAAQLATRIIADRSGVSGDRIRKGQIDATDYARMSDVRAEIAAIPLHIDATGGLSIGKLCARARRAHRKHGLDLIVVDYLQLITTGASNGRSRVQEVSEITCALKALAKELGVPVLALSQLSRQVETRPDKRPMLSDLRESGSIEQDADCVMFVFREAYYLERTEPQPGSTEHLEWAEKMDHLRNVAEVIIGKQRHGPIGTVRLSFDADTTRFGNLAPDGQAARFYGSGE